MGFGENILTALGLCVFLYTDVCFSNAVTRISDEISLQKVKKRLSENRYFITSQETLERSQNMYFWEPKQTHSQCEVPWNTRLLGLSWVTPQPSHSGYGASVNSNPHVTDLNLNENSLSFPTSNHYISKRNRGFLMHLHRDGKWATGELKWFPFSPTQSWH